MKKILCIVFLISMSFALYDLPQVSGGQSDSREYKKANKLFAEGKYSEAIQRYQSILSSMSPGSLRGLLYTRIADGYFNLDDYEKALAAYRSALKDQKYSDRPPTQYWIGFCCFLLGRNAEAVTEFLKIPENYPFSGMWVGTAYYWAGRASDRMGRKGQAAGFYRKASGNGTSTQERFALEKAERAGQGAGTRVR
jgi:tetratricopeptide (TPR) repeat protein